MPRNRRLPRQMYIAILLITFGVICIGISLFLFENKPTKIASSPASVNINAAPSAVKLSPQDVASYTVPAGDPKYIAIPAIGISNTPVVKLGLLKSRAIATPDNIYETGWYDASSKPGQNGAMFIYGHVSSWQADGIFYNLKNLNAGDKVIITRGDNTTYTYEVINRKIYPYNDVDMQQVLSSVSAGVPGLNLMTCTGQVIKGTSNFNERLVVFTRLTS